MDRSELDRFAARHRLSASAAEASLVLTGNRPTAPEWRAFTARLLRAAGIGALGAGLIFFVAANWQAWGLMGRFALLQSGLVLCIGVALWRVPPAPVGQAALLLATLFTGALLALFGQSYQTGADLHELFFTWAALTLPFALGALSGAVWATWWVVFNVGLSLLFGLLGLDNIFWRGIEGWGVGRAVMLMLPCVINLIGSAACLALRGTRFGSAAPLWLARLLMVFGLAYGTVAVLPYLRHGIAALDSTNIALPLYAALSLLLALIAWQRWRDVFPLALLAGSWIIVSTTWLISWLQLGDLGAFFIIALWLIASSTSAGMLLMHLFRRTRVAEGAPR